MSSDMRIRAKGQRCCLESRCPGELPKPRCRRRRTGSCTRTTIKTTRPTPKSHPPRVIRCICSCATEHYYLASHHHNQNRSQIRNNQPADPSQDLRQDEFAVVQANIKFVQDHRLYFVLTILEDGTKVEVSSLIIKHRKQNTYNIQHTTINLFTYRHVSYVHVSTMLHQTTHAATYTQHNNTRFVVVALLLGGIILT